MSMKSMKHLMSNLVRKVSLDGKDWLVVPTVPIVEGSWNGVMYHGNDLAKFTDAWNGRPIVADHPERGGRPISAGDPNVMAKREIGRLFNVEMVDGLGPKKNSPGLRGEMWLDVEKTKKVAPEILTSLENEQNLEVSTGLFTEDTVGKGKFNGRPYSCVATSYRPDHLAVLPEGKKGACSWEDGAGAPRINEDLTVNDGLKTNPDWVKDHDIWDKAKTAAAKTYKESDEAYYPVTTSIYKKMGGRIGAKTKHNSLKALSDKLLKALADAGIGKTPGKNTSCALIRDVDTEDNSFVFDLGGFSFQQHFNQAGGEVKFDGEAEEVNLRQRWEPKDNADGEDFQPGDGDTNKDYQEGRKRNQGDFNDEEFLDEGGEDPENEDESSLDELLGNEAKCSKCGDGLKENDKGGMCANCMTANEGKKTNSTLQTPKRPLTPSEAANAAASVELNKVPQQGEVMGLVPDGYSYVRHGPSTLVCKNDKTDKPKVLKFTRDQDTGQLRSLSDEEKLKYGWRTIDGVKVNWRPTGETIRRAILRSRLLINARGYFGHAGRPGQRGGSSSGVQPLTESRHRQLVQAAVNTMWKRGQGRHGLGHDLLITGHIGKYLHALHLRNGDGNPVNLFNSNTHLNRFERDVGSYLPEKTNRFGSHPGTVPKVNESDAASKGSVPYGGVGRYGTEGGPAPVDTSTARQLCPECGEPVDECEHTKDPYYRRKHRAKYNARFRHIKPSLRRAA